MMRKDWIIEAKAIARNMGGRHIESKKIKCGAVWLTFQFNNRRDPVAFPEYLKKKGIGYVTKESENHIECSVLV